MNREELMFSAVIAAGVALCTPPVNAQSLPEHVQVRLQAAAEEGPGALRRFVARTRMIYALDQRDIASARAGASADELGYELGYVGAVEALETPQPAAEPDAQRAALDEFRERIYRDMLHE